MISIGMSAEADLKMQPGDTAAARRALMEIAGRAPRAGGAVMKPHVTLSRGVRAAILASAMVVTACASLPLPRERQSQIKPLSAYGIEQSFAAPAGQWPTESWWVDYGDPQLDALIAEALAESPSIAVAHARLRRAQAIAEVAGAARQPQLGANASASQQKQSYNYLSPPALTEHGWNEHGRATLDFSWELDFWGKNRAALAAATSEADAARADSAQARLALASSITSSYAELARLHAALDTARAAFEIRIKTVDLLRGRLDNGLETLGGLRQAEARSAAAEADALSITEQVALQRNRIAALMGAGPDRGLSIVRPTVNLTKPFALPEQLPVQLLGRRPDVTAARMRAEAAAKRIEQARASFYPNVNLTAFIGVQSLGLDMLTRDGSSIGAVGPAISLPIFTGGKLRGQLHSAGAEHAEAVANYDRTVVQALQEVADAALSQRALDAQIAKADAAVNAAREAWRIQNDRYAGGLSTYLDVLSAEDYLLSNTRLQSDLHSRSFALDVALVRALGGGYSNTL